MPPCPSMGPSGTPAGQQGGASAGAPQTVRRDVTEDTASSVTSSKDVEQRGGPAPFPAHADLACPRTGNRRPAAEPWPRVGGDHRQEEALWLAGPDDPQIRPHGQRVHRVSTCCRWPPQCCPHRGPPDSPGPTGARCQGSGPQSSRGVWSPTYTLRTRGHRGR